MCNSSRCATANERLLLWMRYNKNFIRCLTFHTFFPAVRINSKRTIMFFFPNQSRNRTVLSINTYYTARNKTSTARLIKYSYNQIHTDLNAQISVAHLAKELSSVKAIQILFMERVYRCSGSINTARKKDILYTPFKKKFNYLGSQL